VKNLDFCVKHERCEHIFCVANQLLQIQRLSENNKSVAQNANVDFNLRAIGQQLKLLSRTSKDLKDEVNSIKQQTTKLMVRRALWNIRSNFEKFVDKNTDVGEYDYYFASATQGMSSGPNRARRNVNFHCLGNCEDVDGDLDSIKLKIPNS
jgi:hypothetical protein